MKPSHEPVALCRKPGERTFAENILEHGVGALNIDAGRIAVHDASYAKNCSGDRGHADNRSRDLEFGMGCGRANDGGRWPSNVLFDEQAVSMLDAQGGGTGDGGASRFFYVVKAGSDEKWFYCRYCNVVAQRSADLANHTDHQEGVVVHPTQKPVELMEYLIKLVTPPGGVVLDPFCGTGTTAVAAKRLGFNFVTCDLDPDYVRIAETRIAAAVVSADERSALRAGALMCPRCKESGTITLLDQATVERARDAGRKVTCVKCLKRFTPEEIVGE